MIVNNWVGFKAEWIANRELKKNNYQQDNNKHSGFDKRDYGTEITKL
jgi:hypothetical protein